MVPSPDVRGRQEILELYLQGKPMSDDVDVKAIARGTPGFNGAGGYLKICNYILSLSYGGSMIHQINFSRSCKPCKHCCH